jgi:hypothetical protein
VRSISIQDSKRAKAVNAVTNTVLPPVSNTGLLVYAWHQRLIDSKEPNNVDQIAAG